jgi:PAS domain-containing protein
MEATYFSEEMFRIMGVPPADNPPSMEEIAALFAPEVWGRVTKMFNAARLNKTTFDGEFPLRSRDGVERVVRFVGHPVLGASGEILEIVGTAIDITEQRQARAALQRAFDEIKVSEDRLRLIIDSIPVPAWSSRPDGSSDFMNQRWLDYTGTRVCVGCQPSRLTWLRRKRRRKGLFATAMAPARSSGASGRCSSGALSKRRSSISTK